MNGYTTKIITTIGDVPSDHVPVTHFRGLVNNVPWATISKAISEAHFAGQIRACKLVRGLGDLKTGRVFVHEGDTTQFLAARYSPAPQTPVQPHVQEPTPEPAVVSDAAPELRTAELIAAIHGLTIAVQDLTAAMQLKAESVCEDAYTTNGFHG